MLRQEFAVALIDVMMPGMNGFETAANIKGLDQTKDIPIILLTGAAVDPNYAYRGYTVGAADFLIKPFDPWLLRTKVNVFLELHRKNRQLADQTEQLTRLLAVDVPTKPAEEQHRLAEVEHQLAQVHRLLREREGTDALDAADLADRIAVLERAVGRLVEGRDP
jgi:response regulator RpfG family c-di-GMP phosphodiesterase